MSKITFLSWVFSLSLGLIWPTGYFALAISMVSLLAVGAFVSARSNVHMMFFAGYSTFLFLPAIFNWIYLDVDFSLFLLSSLASATFLSLTRKTEVKEFIDYGFPLRAIFFSSCLIILSLNLIGPPELSNALFAFLLMLMSMSFKSGSPKNNIIVFSCFIVVFLFFSIFSWSGFGRTVVFGWLLLALLQFSYSMNINVNKYIFSITPGMASTLLSNRSISQLEFTGLKSSLYDSAYSPYRLASSFIENFNQRGYDFSGFFDQVIFTFLIFIPRSIWPEKPYGFGFEYTVRHLDNYLIDAGHSIASTLIGDHIYYLGILGFITSTLILSVIAHGVNMLYRVNGLNGNGVIIFSASMMVLVWGGMTSFSARVILPIIIFMVFLAALRRIIIFQLKLKKG